MKRLLLLGLALRLGLMPWTMHSDILDQYWRAHFLSHHGIWNLPELMISRFGFPSAPLLPMDVLHGVWLWLIGPLLPGIHDLFLDTPEAMVILTDMAGHQRAVLHFLANGPLAWWTLLLFKLPYLAFDYGALALVLRLVPGEAARRQVAVFWMFNFVSLFTLYVWGRYDGITVFLVLAALALARRERTGWAMLVLGAATITKYYPVFFLASWLLCLGRRPRDWLRLALCFFILPTLLGALGLVLSFGQAGESILNVGYQIKNVVRIGWDVGDIFWKEPFYLYPFIMAYAGLVLHTLYTNRRGFDDLVGCSLATLMLFYALSAFSPQYFYWSIPFVALCLHKRPDVPALHWLMTIFFVLGLLELGSDLVNTLSPILPSLVIEPLQPRYYAKLNHIYPVVLGIFRSLFSALCLFLGYLLLARNPPSVPLVFQTRLAPGSSAQPDPHLH